ncbi:MAG: hypothetical protein Q4C96_00105 [Planctomycetia bacterium]|nr:hypothetical protein [Planctomycetia bacterium]
MKGKFNTEALKEFFLAHVEKLIFGIFVLMFFGIVWSSMFQVKGFSLTPEELSRVTRSAKTRLDDDSVVKSIPIEDFSALSEKLTQDIHIKDLSMSVAWNPPLFPERQQRTQPEVFSVEDLRVVSGRGQFSITQEEGSDYEEDARGPSQGGKYWNVVMGAIPLKKQSKAFEKALGVSLTPSGTAISAETENFTDNPTYHTYVVERATVPKNGDMNNLRWEVVGPEGENLDVARKINALPSSGKHNFPDLTTSPRQKSLSLFVPPPLMVDAQEIDQPVRNRGKRKETRTHLQESGEKSLMNPLPPMISSGKRDVDWKQRLNFPANIDVGAELPPGRRADEEMMIRSSRRDQNELADYRLFLFVDYTVEPDVKYVYRVKLQLHNPNYMYKPTHYVSSEEIRKIPYLDTSWSAPSVPVQVERDTRFLSAGYRAIPTGRNKFSFAPALMLIYFDQKSGEERYACFEEVLQDTEQDDEEEESTSRRKPQKKSIRFREGQQLNFQVKNTRLKSSESRNSSKDEDVEILDINTDFVILDTSERRELYNKYDQVCSPLRMLLMAPDGSLVIQSEVADISEVYSRDPEFFAPKKPEETEEETSEKDSKKRGKKKENESLI